MTRSPPAWQRYVGLIAIAVAVASIFLPYWATFLALIGLAKGLVVLGLMILWRTGLVSFGQGLYYGLGAYTVGLLPQLTGISDGFVLMIAGTAVATAVSFLLGFLLRRYRGLFFAMLNLAFSMILFGLLVNSEHLGSTDGFNIANITYAGYAPEGLDSQRTLYVITVALVIGAGWLAYRYLNSTMGHLTTAIRDNEIRVEYLGFSVERAVHAKYVIACALAGLGGTIAAIGVGHIDPETTVYWLQSGEFVFVTVLSGTGHPVAPFLGAIIFELLRSFALEYAPNIWQMIVGIALLACIMFLPDGLWSLLVRRRAETRNADRS